MTAIATRNESFYDHRASGRMSKQQQIIVTLIKLDDTKANWTLQEISVATGMQINTVSGRVNELKSHPLFVLEECERRKCRITGRTVTPVRIASAQPDFFD